MDRSFDAKILSLLGEAEEVSIETRRDAGSPVHRTIVWTVVVEGEVFVRSVRARKGRWYRELSSNPEGALHVGEARMPVRAVPATDAATTEAVSDAFRGKYEDTWPGPTAAMVRPGTLPTTLKLSPT